MVDYSQFAIQIINNVNSNPRGPTPYKGPNGSYITQKFNNLLSALNNDLGSIETQISTNSSNISGNSNQINTNQSNISNNSSQINTNQSNISNHETRITNIEQNNNLESQNIVKIRTDQLGSDLNTTIYNQFESQGGNYIPKIIVHHFPFYLPFYYFDGTQWAIRDLSSNGKELLFNDNSLITGGIYDINEAENFLDISQVFNDNKEGYYFIAMASLEIDNYGNDTFRVYNNPMELNILSNSRGHIENFSATENDRFFNTNIEYPTTQTGASYTNETWNTKWYMLAVRDKGIDVELAFNYD